MIPAIPTTYAGVNFRSRLEARYAAFFDLVGWTWDYEPWDLGGYIPDFLIDRSLVIECKPSIGDDWHNIAFAKIHKAHRDNRDLTLPRMIVCGSGPWVSGRSLAIGHHFPIGNEVWFAYCASCAGLTLCDVPAHMPAARCLRCTEANLIPLAPQAPAVISLWRSAGNEVQWKAGDAFASSLVQSAKEEK